MATQLQAVNEVLLRLREQQVVTTADNSYSQLISLFVNDARREVEDSYNWNSLRTTISITCVPATFEYVLTGIGERFKVIDVVNRPGISPGYVQGVLGTQMTFWLLQANVARGIPYYYAPNGLDVNGDTKVDLFPIPDQAYVVNFNVCIPQPITLTDATQIQVPSQIVILGALAKAYYERGEGYQDQFKVIQAQYVEALESAVSQEEGYLPYETDWVAM